MAEIHGERNEAERRVDAKDKTDITDLPEGPDDPDEADSHEENALDPEGDDDPERAEDPEGDDDPDGEYEHALEQSEKTDSLDDSDRLDHLDQDELDAEAVEDWDEDSGLIYDVHKQYDKMIDDLSAKDSAGELDEAGREKLADLKAAVERYDETGIEMQPQYPENNGFYGEVSPRILGEEEIISRFDVADSEAGSGCFASPEGTDYDGRALPYDPSKKEEHFFRVEPGARIEVQAGEVRDFEKDEGTGEIQYQFDKPISEYVKEGKMYECDAEGNRLNPGDRREED